MSTYTEGSANLPPESVPRVGIDEAILDNLTSPRDVAHLALTTVLEDSRSPDQVCFSSGVCDPCMEPHIQKLADSVEDGKPMELMIHAFPCKSPNPDKVLGELPDMAEVISLRHINGWTERIRSFYEPGANVVICADGRAFSDLVEVPDETVNAYVAGIRGIIQESGFSITYAGLDELIPDLAAKGDYDGQRTALDENAVSIESLRQRMQEDPNLVYQINGIERFLAEDLRLMHPKHSKTQLKKLARTKAYEIIRRGDALRDEFEVHYPQVARLTVHPQTGHSKKLGVHITPSREDWVTPWHAAAITNEDGFRLIKRKQAEERGAALMHFADGRPSHFELSQTSA